MNSQHYVTTFLTSIGFIISHSSFIIENLSSVGQNKRQMNYISKIEAYSEGTMSELEKMLFEQELEENVILKEEWEAYKLTQDLLSFTALHIPEVEIVNPITEPVPLLVRSTVPYKSILAGASMFLVGLMGWYSWNTNVKKSAKNNLMIEQLKPIQSSSEQKESIFIEHQETEDINSATPLRSVKKQEKKAKVATQATLNPIKPTSEPIALKKEPIIVRKKTIPLKKNIANNTSQEVVAIGKKEPTPQVISKNLPIAPSVEERQQDIISNKIVTNGTAIVFEASSSITLKPGFSVEAGGSFNAAIKSDK